MLKLSRKARNSSSSSLSPSPSSKAKRALFPEERKRQKERKESVSSQEGETPLHQEELGKDPSPVEVRPTKRKGSLLELQGKLGVLVDTWVVVAFTLLVNNL